jgi:hypothetical protein
MSRVDREIIALGNYVDDRLDIADIEIGRDALGVEVESKVDEIDVACAFAVPEEAAFDAIATCENGQFCGSNSSSCNMSKLFGRLV